MDELLRKKTKIKSKRKSDVLVKEEENVNNKIEKKKKRHSIF